MQSTEFIHFMSTMVHHNAHLYSFKTSNKNAYSKVLGNGLSSSFGSDFDDLMSFFSDGASCSTLNFYLLVSVDGA